MKAWLRSRWRVWRWVGRLAVIYLLRGRRKKTAAASLLTWLGVVLGVATLVTVLSVMNGFQSLTIDSLVEVASFHVRVYGAVDAAEVERVVGEGVVVPQVEVRVLAGDLGGEVEFVEVRGVPEGMRERDPGFARVVEVREGVFRVGEGRVVVGQELAYELGVGVGDSLVLTGLSVGETGILVPVRRGFVVSAVFRTGNYQIDRSMLFMGLEDARLVAGGDDGSFLAVKLPRPSRAQEVKRRLVRAGYEAVTWEEYNRALFDALRMEKLFLVFLVGLIFLVLGLNLVHGFRRSIFERRGELALLVAVGARVEEVRRVFLLEGIVLGATGAFLGTMWGYLLSININRVFSWVESMLNAGIHLWNALGRFWGGRFRLGSVRIFSPQSFYLLEIPFRVYPVEVLGIVLYAVLVSGGAAYLATRMLRTFSVTEVLRNE
ncbi:protein of unknown function DUF214 [Spirochaeta thermophila DSM 6578]|uniref:Uncharacterized protein n=1 Tax=Winmispira thermophila (strain ATCC 700085 / DSM 6578 / Z-1203) TaxID=869211 RepID=G0GFD2_WINT7|nr:ABC transporter permease [Spirochaeta thermophila]AEJ61546.1 protein of unknown function DUF214 [Spirochaeta thermophila DSM 6578]